jgi:NAD(P)-dependent dehydrogenase (short-subunit alcohol dehydrogenase family)
MTLKGIETALVTGASSGIGKALTLRLAKEGVHVAISARRKAALDALADEVERAGGRRPIVLPSDLSKRGEAAKLGAAAEEAFGGRGVDVLVSNAGVGIGGAQLVVADDDIARELFETNYWSPLALARALAPGMRARPRPHRQRDLDRQLRADAAHGSLRVVEGGALDGDADPPHGAPRRPDPRLRGHPRPRRYADARRDLAHPRRRKGVRQDAARDDRRARRQDRARPC